MAGMLLSAPPRIERSVDRGSPLTLQTRGVGVWLGVRRRPTFWVGVAVVALFALAAAAAPIISPADPTHAFRDGGLTAAGDPVGPSPRFLLGTDHLGRDYLSRLLYGARVSLVVGIGASIVALSVGVLVGMTAAIAGTVRVRLRLPLVRRTVAIPIPVEGLLMRMTDAALALPAVLLAIALAATIGPSVELTVAVVAAFLWTGLARIVYSQVRSLRSRDFIVAAQAIGVSPSRIASRHLVPHLVPVVVAYAPIVAAAAVLFEATLSFLGVGVPPPSPSWGSMIADHASFYASDPRLLVVPGGALMATVFSFNLIADALRDAVDPRVKGTS